MKLKHHVWLCAMVLRKLFNISLLYFRLSRLKKRWASAKKSISDLPPDRALQIITQARWKLAAHIKNGGYTPEGEIAGDQLDKELSDLCEKIRQHRDSDKLS